ncbi:MurR/RpiR family transcriptional regulator [Oscillospiraceae bacterium LTW-04]|nr:MurR/RpiR family transcriptional regulator [Oscillospiraceae bacterium MB24-C1]
MSTNKIERLFENWTSLSKKQRQLCDYMIKNVDTLADATAEEVAKSAGVGKATLFRMLHDLGYTSFMSFKVDLSSHLSHSSYPNYWQMQRMLTNSEKVDSLYSSIENAVAILGTMIAPTFERSFRRAVELLERAPEIGVIGCRSSNLLAQYFEALMLTTPKRVSVLSMGEHFSLDRVGKLPTASSILVIARWPYTKLTMDTAQYAQKLGHSVILMTNNENCRLNDIATEILLTPKVEDKYSIIPFAAIIEALVDELCVRFSPQTLRSIEQANSALQKYDLMEW